MPRWKLSPTHPQYYLLGTGDILFRSCVVIDEGLPAQSFVSLFILLPGGEMKLFLVLQSSTLSSLFAVGAVTCWSGLALSMGKDLWTSPSHPPFTLLLGG